MYVIINLAWESIYPFLNFDAAAVEVWKIISKSTPHFRMDVITYPCWDQSYSALVKGIQGAMLPTGCIRNLPLPLIY